MTATCDSAVLGSIGRKHVRFALSGEDGSIRPGTIRSYSADATTGVSAALIAFQRDLNLPALPRRSAVSVPGLVRGDTISISNTRWFLSRSGLAAMLGEPPLILNDFAAEAWAFASVDTRVDEAFGGAPGQLLRQPGCFLIIGITSGLGVAVVNRSETGAVTVLATEAGHGVFAGATDELARLANDLFAGQHPVASEDIVSARGLVAIHALLARRASVPPRAATPEDVTRLAATDPIARGACQLLARAFWAQAGNLVMTFGAWDGVLITGAVAGAIRPFLRQPEAQALFANSAKYRRALLSVPRSLIMLENAELIGLARALHHQRMAAIPEPFPSLRPAVPAVPVPIRG